MTKLRCGAPGAAGANGCERVRSVAKAPAKASEKGREGARRRREGVAKACESTCEGVKLNISRHQDHHKSLALHFEKLKI